MDQKVQDFIADLEVADPQKAEIVVLARDMYINVVPNLSEKFIYGGIGIFLDESMLGGIYAYSDHVSIIFSHGYKLDDKFKQLEGKGKYRRHIKIHNKKELENKNVDFYIKQNAKLKSYCESNFRP